jgi:hypothetical protein
MGALDNIFKVADGAVGVWILEQDTTHVLTTASAWILLNADGAGSSLPR